MTTFAPAPQTVASLADKSDVMTTGIFLDLAEFANRAERRQWFDDATIAAELGVSVGEVTAARAGQPLSGAFIATAAWNLLDHTVPAFADLFECRAA
ncbi:MAG TPA: hypothetical protein VGH11_04180 [Jatrophihabitans sp.]